MFKRILEKLKLSVTEFIVLIIAVATFLAGVIMLGGYVLDTVKSKNATQSLIDEAVTYTDAEPAESGTDAHAGATAAEPEGEEVPEETPKPREIPIEVDFDSLRQKNADIVGWIYSADTPINLAIPYNGSDTYYLSRSSTREENRYGTIYIAGNCSPDFSDPNTVLYGHNMQNGTILGTLREYKSQEYFEQHRVMYLLTPAQNYRAEVVAGYMHTAMHALYDLPNSRDFTAGFVTTAIAESIFTSGAKYNPDANYITFSTCSDDYDGARLALVCELVPLDE